MSSAGNRGMISNNAGAPNWNFGKRYSGNASENNGSTTERRRSSATSAQKFANLHNHKRNSQDASVAARKASSADMYKPPGFIGSVWDRIRGTAAK